MANNAAVPAALLVLMQFDRPVAYFVAAVSTDFLHPGFIPVIDPIEDIHGHSNR